MIGLFVVALAQAVSPHASLPAGRKPDEWCRGIEMPNGHGSVNLLWTTIRGPEGNLNEIAELMKGMGAIVTRQNGEAHHSSIQVSYRDDLDVRAVGQLLNEIDAGKHGQVKTDDFAMSVDTLPPDKCIRLNLKP